MHISRSISVGTGVRVIWVIYHPRRRCVKGRGVVRTNAGNRLLFDTNKVAYYFSIKFAYWTVLPSNRSAAAAAQHIRPRIDELLVASCDSLKSLDHYS